MEPVVEGRERPLQGTPASARFGASISRRHGRAPLDVGGQRLVERCVSELEGTGLEARSAERHE